MKLLSMVPYDASVDSCPRPQKAQPQCTLWACSDVMSMQIHCDRCSDPVRGVDGGGGDGVWKSVPSIQFCCEPKTVLKIKSVNNDVSALWLKFALLKLLVNPCLLVTPEAKRTCSKLIS